MIDIRNFLTPIVILQMHTVVLVDNGHSVIVFFLSVLFLVLQSQLAESHEVHLNASL